MRSMLLSFLATARCMLSMVGVSPGIHLPPLPLERATRNFHRAPAAQNTLRHGIRSTMTANAEAEVVVREAPGKGQGAFAAAPISAGSWVCRYEGRLVGFDEFIALSNESMSLIDYMFKVVDPETDEGESDYLFIDGMSSSHFSRFFNHDRYGTLEIRVNSKERAVDFHARRDIKAGEELTFDYGPEYWSSRSLQPLGDSRMLGWIKSTLDSGEPFWWNADGAISFADPNLDGSAELL